MKTFVKNNLIGFANNTANPKKNFIGNYLYPIDSNVILNVTDSEYGNNV